MSGWLELGSARKKCPKPYVKKLACIGHSNIESILVTTIPLLTFTVFFFKFDYKLGHMLYAPCVWLILLDIISSRFICIFGNDRIFILNATLLYVYIALTTYHVHALIDTIGRSLLLAIMKDDCINVARQTAPTYWLQSSMSKYSEVAGNGGERWIKKVNHCSMSRMF